MSLNLDKTAPLWIGDAIPPALSRMYFHSEKRYTTLTAVNEAFYHGDYSPPGSAVALDAAIRNVMTLDPSKLDKSYVLLGSDDKGIVDFVQLSFYIFGPKTDSVIKTYALVLIVSCLIFIVTYGREPVNLLILGSFLVMHGQIMPAVTFNQQVGSPVALRAIPILSMVACFHCLLFFWRNHTSVISVILLTIQVAVIYFVVHIRTPTIWQVVTISLFFCGGLIYRLLKKAPTASIITCLFPLIFMSFGYGSLVMYRANAYPDEYKRGQQIMTRVFWHNIFSGFALNHDFAEHLKLRIDDVSVIRATGVYLKETGRDKDWEAIGGNSPNFANMRWAPYDTIVRGMLVSRCEQNPWDCLRALVWDKPVSLLGDLAWLYGLRHLPPGMDLFVSPDVGDGVKTQIVEATRQLDHGGLRANPLGYPSWLLIPFIWLLWRANSYRYHPALKVCIVLAAGSLIPSFIGYPSAHTIAEPGIAIGMLVQIAVIVGSAKILSTLPLRTRTKDRY